jgi:hypothetical protein
MYLLWAIAKYSLWAIALFTMLQKIRGEKGIFSVSVFNRDPPQPPLKRGAFRLTVMCKGIYSDPPNPLKKGSF